MSQTVGAVNLLTLDFIYSNIPNIPGMGEEVSTSSFDMLLGGGPVAGLVTASRLGAPAKLATCLGQDRISGMARTMLEEERLEYQSFYTPGTPSPVNVTSVMTFEGQDRAFVSYFPEVDFHSTHLDAIYDYVKDTSYCILSSPCLELLERLKENGCRVVYDVGWSDQLSLDALKEVLRQVYLFAPNEKEALKLTGASTPEGALTCLADYVEQPVVKLGKEGALVWHENTSVHIPPVDFTPVDATGAGDAFLGGVTYGLLQGWDILRCVQLGNYSGGKATTAIGCLTARGSLEEFERMCGRL